MCRHGAIKTIGVLANNQVDSSIGSMQRKSRAYTLLQIHQLDLAFE